MIKSIEKSKSQKAGVEIFLDLSFIMIPKETYVDLSYAKQSGPILEEDYRQAIRKHVKEFLEQIWYNGSDFKRFEINFDRSVLDTSNKKEMFELFMEVARDVAKGRDERSDAFWKLS